MLEELKDFVREYKNRVKKDEVIARLSFSVWKTCNRILEEVDAARVEKGEKPVNPRLSWWSAKIDTRQALTMLLIKGTAEMKHESDLTATETAWASKSDGSADDEETKFRKEYGYGELAFYRFAGGAGKRKPKEDELPKGVLEPIVVRG